MAQDRKSLFKLDFRQQVIREFALIFGLLLVLLKLLLLLLLHLGSDRSGCHLLSFGARVLELTPFFVLHLFNLFLEFLDFLIPLLDFLLGFCA